MSSVSGQDFTNKEFGDVTNNAHSSSSALCTSNIINLIPSPSYMMQVSFLLSSSCLVISGIRFTECNCLSV